MLEGYNALKPKLEGMDKEDIKFYLTMLDSNQLMPPFVGTEEEREALATFLDKKINGGL